MSYHVVQRAWRHNTELSVHGCIYTLKTGILKDLSVRYSEINHTNDIYQLKKGKRDIYKPAVEIMKSNYEGR